MKPKLLVVTSTFPRWKNDTDPPFVYELSKRLTRDFEVVVHTPHYRGAQSRETMDETHVHRFRYFFNCLEILAGGQGIVPKLRRNKLYVLILPFFLTAQLFSLILLTTILRPDVIHAHWLIPQGFFAVLIKKMFGIPVIITAHGADIFSFRSSIFIRLKRFIVNNADLIVTVSNSLVKVLSADIKKQFQYKVISMGVDSTIFSPDKKSVLIRQQYGIKSPFLLFVGRLTEKKGVRYLIDAMVKVIISCPDAKLLIIGHGELEDALKRQVTILNLQESVLFIGGLSNEQLPPYYASADIFIGPSIIAKGGDTEGFGLTFVEAAMSGCLVIGSRVGGIEDIIEDGETGYLVPPGDSNALAAKIVDVVVTLNNHENMKEKARRAVVGQFGWNSIATRYTDAYLSHL